MTGSSPLLEAASSLTTFAYVTKLTYYLLPLCHGNPNNMADKANNKAFTCRACDLFWTEHEHKVNFQWNFKRFTHTFELLWNNWHCRAHMMMHGVHKMNMMIDQALTVAMLLENGCGQNQHVFLFVQKHRFQSIVHTQSGNITLSKVS